MRGKGVVEGEGHVLKDESILTFIVRATHKMTNTTSVSESLLLLQKKRNFQVQVKHETSGREGDQLPDRLVSWTSRSNIIIYCDLCYTTDIQSFHIVKQLPAECPAKPLSFFFSDTPFGSSEEMTVLDVKS